MTFRLLRRCLSTSSLGPPRQTAKFSSAFNNLGDAIDDACDLTFLGTGSGGPTRSRNAAAVVFRWQGKQMMFDCGEGTLRQMFGSQVHRPMHLDLIFITHLHGDHIFGLPSVLLHASTAISSSFRSTEDNSNMHSPTAPRIRVFGPVGLYEFIRNAIVLSESIIHTHIEVHELEGRRPAQNSRNHRRHPRIHRHVIPCQSDGTWLCHEMSARNTGPSIRVKAAAVRHTVPTLGFVVEESSLPGSIDVEAVRRMGLKPGPKYRELKEGNDVTLDDGVTVIRSNDVVSRRVKGRKIAIVGDTCDASGPYEELAKGADLVVHEATVPGRHNQDKALRIGHSTPTMAAHFAQAVQASRLVLTHFGSRFDSGYFARNQTVLTPASPTCEGAVGGFIWSGGRGLKHPDQIATAQLVQEAQSALQCGQVVAANDFMMIKVPRGGFADVEEKGAKK